MALNLNYKPNKLVDITTLTEDQWLDWRRKGIGGSDVAVALNSSPYRTARELYYDKIGVVMADEGPDKSITFQIGHLLEDVVAQIFAKKTGLSTGSLCFRMVERPSSNAKPRTMICSSSGRMALCHAIMSCRCDTTWPS